MRGEGREGESLGEGEGREGESLGEGGRKGRRGGEGGKLEGEQEEAKRESM